jgi:hypothetical protein
MYKRGFGSAGGTPALLNPLSLTNRGAGESITRILARYRGQWDRLELSFRGPRGISLP